MGTPGDKSSFGKVVPDKPSTPEPETETETTPQLTSTDVPSTSQQEATTVGEMGVISHLPEFHVLTSPSYLPALSKPEIFQQQSLEQASIEDYFKPTTFHRIDQPGPSGLQAQKAKAAPIPSRVKKKKQEQGPHKKNHTCPVCHKSFATSEKLNKHYQSHSGAAQFKCEHCKKTFTSKFKLVRHALIHSDRKPFSCTVCERTFHRKDHLKNHIKVHSPTKKLYECDKPDCKKQYTSLLSYRKHLAVHAAEEGNLTCQICFATFQTKDEILYHLKIHAGSRTVKNPNEKKFLCEYCDRRFFTKKDVRRHLVVHTGMRDFLCQFCPQRFGRKDHLVRHIKKSHHKQYTEAPITIKSEPSTSKSAKPETVTSDTSEQGLMTAVALSEESSDIELENVKTIFEEQYETFGVKEEIGESSEIKVEPTELSKEAVLGLEGVKTIFEEEHLTPLEEEQLLFSSQSTQSELKELCIEIFKDIEEEPSTSSLPSTSAIPLEEEPQPTEEEILDPQMFEFLQPSEENKRPLPGFSQTFQPPPPP